MSYLGQYNIFMIYLCANCIPDVEKKMHIGNSICFVPVILNVLAWYTLLFVHHRAHIAHLPQYDK